MKAAAIWAAFLDRSFAPVNNERERARYAFNQVLSHYKN
jgi:hypothetical protein